MPIYATQAQLIEAVGHDESALSSDHDATGAYNPDAIAAALRSASAEIESYAGPYGIVPADVGPTDPATAGTFPTWWTEAAIDIALYRVSRGGDVDTKQKRQRYEDWQKRLEKAYPSQINGKPVGGKVTIVGGPREFSRAKVVGL